MKNKGLIITLLVVGVAVYLWRRKKNADPEMQEKSAGLFGIGSIIPSLFKAPTTDSTSTDTLTKVSLDTSDSSTSTDSTTTSTDSTRVSTRPTSDGGTVLATRFTFRTDSKSPFACMRDSQI